MPLINFSVFPAIILDYTVRSDHSNIIFNTCIKMSLNQKTNGDPEKETKIDSQVEK